jgi:hypothetical protein
LAVILSAEIQQRSRAEQRLTLAQSQVAAADARLLMPTELNAALRQSASAYRINASDDARAALLDGLGRSARIVRFYPCGNGWKSGGLTISSEPEPTVAFSCLQGGNSVVAVVDHSGHVRQWQSIPGEVRNLVFPTSDSIAIDGAPALRVIALHTGQILSFAAGKERLIGFAAIPGRSALLTLQTGSQIRQWQHNAGAAPESSWVSGTPFTSPFGIASLEYNSVLQLIEIHAYGGNFYALPVADSASLGTGIHEIADDPSLSFESGCEKYPMVTRTGLHVGSVSADGHVHAYLTDDNHVAVARNGGCTVLSGNTHNSQIVVSPDGRWIATLGAYLSSDTVHGLIVWDLERLHPLAQVLWPDTRTALSVVPQVALSYDGASWAFVRADGVAIWNGRPITAPNDPQVRVTAITISRDGRELSVGYSDGHIARLGPDSATPLRVAVQLSQQRIQSIWYADSDLYVMDRVGRGWRVSESGSPTALPLQVGSVGYPCQYVAESGPELVVELQPTREHPALELLNGADGRNSRFAIPADAGSCGSLVYAAAARVAVRIPQEYTDMYIFEPGRRQAFRAFPNPLYDVSGLRKVLTNPVMSSDGTTLATIASLDSLAIFDVTTARLLGTMAAPRAEALAISGNGRKVLSYNNRIGVISWDMDADHWARIAADMAGLDPRAPQ